MTRLFRFGFVAALGGFAALNFASCAVDKSAFTFDDDEFARVSGDGDDDGDGSGGGTNPGGVGGEGGEPLVVEGEAPESCDASSMRCTGRQVEFCTGEAWVAAGGVCEFACVAGACSGICVPGDKRCASDIEEQVCNDLGQWDDPDFCEFACVGDVEEGECGGECLPGNAGCGTIEFDPDDEFADEDLIRCGATGEWALESACPGDCSSNTVGKVSTAQCTGGCIETDEQCITNSSGAAVETCGASSEWGDVPPNTVQQCGTGIPCIADECGVCVPGTKECNGAAGARKSRTCGQDGQWLPETSCPFVCTAGQCSGECVPGDERCFASKEGQPPDLIQACNANGVWKETDNCGERQLQCVTVGTKKTCGECNPGPNANRCSFTNVQTCDEGTWRTTDECSNACEAARCIDLSFACQEVYPDGPTGCFKPEYGWLCAGVGDKPKSVTCNCENGQGCQAN